MSTNSSSSSRVFIAWAMPVSVAQLGARLFAYTETKATVTAFRLVTRSSGFTACNKLPEEVISSIASEIRDIAYKRRMKERVKISRCLANTCTTLSHVPQADIDSLSVMVSSNYAENDEWLAEQFTDEAYEAHKKAVRRYCGHLMNLNGTSRLAKCAKIFTQDFGIHPYFMIRKFYELDDEERLTIAGVEAEAYMTLPLLYAPISSDPGPRAALFAVKSVLDPSVLVGPTEVQLKQFKRAANILHLHAYNPDEDETEFEDKPRTRETAYSDEDSGSGGSEDGDNNGDGAEDDGARSDGAESYGVNSDAVESDEVALQGQQVAGNVSSDIKTDGIAPELTADHVGGNLRIDVDSEEEEGPEEESWPQLMILGCGKLEVENLYY